MSLKSFIIASIVIHLTVGVALYFYYNPIVLDPKPVLVKKTELKEKAVTKDSAQQKSAEKTFSNKKTLKKTEVKPKKKKMETEGFFGAKRSDPRARAFRGKPC